MHRTETKGFWISRDQTSLFHPTKKVQAAVKRSRIIHDRWENLDDGEMMIGCEQTSSFFLMKPLIKYGRVIYKSFFENHPKMWSTSLNETDLKICSIYWRQHTIFSSKQIRLLAALFV